MHMYLYPVSMTYFLVKEIFWKVQYIGVIVKLLERKYSKIDMQIDEGYLFYQGCIFGRNSFTY